MRKILKILFGLILLLVLVIGGFALGVYLRLFDTQALNDAYGLHELPVVGEYFVPPTAGEEHTETASTTATPAPAGHGTPSAAGGKKPPETVKISMSSAWTSISPVGISGFLSFSARKTTVPRTAMQYSVFKETAVCFTISGAASPTVICVMPYLSRSIINVRHQTIAQVHRFDQRAEVRVFPDTAFYAFFVRGMGAEDGRKHAILHPTQV